MSQIEDWEPYRYDLLGVFRRVLGWVRVAPDSDLGVATLSVLLFCGGPGLVAALGGHLLHDDQRLLVFSWRHDLAACVGLGVLLPGAVVAVNGYYRATVDPAQAKLWSQILTDRTHRYAGGWCALLCLSAAFVAMVAGILTDDGARNLTEHVRFWDSPYTFRHVYGAQPSARLVALGWVVRSLSALVHFCAYAVLFQSLAKVLAVNVAIKLRFSAKADLEIFDGQLNEVYFGLGSVGSALLRSIVMEILFALVFALQQITANDVKAFAHAPQSVMQQPHFAAMICFIGGTFGWVLWPLLRVHWGMARLREQELKPWTGRTDLEAMEKANLIRGMSTWPLRTTTLATASTVLVGAILGTALPPFITAATPRVADLLHRLSP